MSDAAGNQDHLVAALRTGELLRAAKEAAERDAKEARAIARLLDLSLRQTDMVGYLQTSLDTLLANVPWLTLLPKGAIFLEQTAQDGTSHGLHLTVHNNLSPELLTLCAHVPHGKCLCGRAAATREIQFARCLDARHEISFAGIKPHGHYNLPIQVGATLLGVLVIYLPHDYVEEGGERAFLSQVADVLASGIIARRTRSELEEARIRAEAGARAKSEFLATMSHEIRTPMNGILGMAQILEQTGLSAEQQEYVQTILQSGRALLTILNDILDFSTIEAGRLEIAPIEFDLERNVVEVTHLVAPRAEEKGLELRVRYAASCPRRLVGDAPRIRQVLLNLLGNAVKFTEQGSIEVSVECAGCNNDGQPRLRIAVSDTGIGIAAEAQASIFEPFMQIDASHARKFSGIGLGLAISRRLVELMKGEIGIDRRPAGGSVFWFTLPLPLGTAASRPTLPTSPSGDDAPVKVGAGGTAAASTATTADEPRIDHQLLEGFRSQFGEDFAMLVDTFIDSTPALFADMNSALAANDAIALRRHAHSLKSSAATYGARRLASMASNCEQEIAAGRLAGIQHAIHALHEEFTAVATLLAASRNA